MHNVVLDVITFPIDLSTTSVLLVLLHVVITIPDAMSYDKKIKLSQSCFQVSVLYPLCPTLLQFSHLFFALVLSRFK